MLPETLPPPLKAVPLGKVASPQAMTEGVIIGTPLSAKARRCGGKFCLAQAGGTLSVFASQIHLPREGEVLLYLPEDAKKLPLRGSCHRR